MYVLRAALSSIARNKLMAFISLGVIVVSMFVLGIFLTITVNFQSIVTALKEKVEIRVFLNDEIDKTGVGDIEGAIMAVEGVENVFYTSKDDALDRFREEYKDKADLLDLVEGNPLPASFSVKLLPEYRTEVKASTIASRIEKMEGVEEAEYGKEWVARLDEVVRILVMVDASVGVIIALSCLFLVFNTIRLTVFARKEEIEIMSLVGATSSFIRRPFLLVGLFYGFLGGVLASAMLYAIYQAVIVKVPAIKFLEPAQLGGLVLFATLLGYFGSVFSVRRFVAT